MAFAPPVCRLRNPCVPFRPKSGPFVVNQRESSLFVPTGSAAITGAAWGLPVAVINPGDLGDAGGVSALMLWLDPGLRASWLGQPQQVERDAAILIAESGSLSVRAATAHGEDGTVPYFWFGVHPAENNFLEGAKSAFFC